MKKIVDEITGNFVKIFEEIYLRTSKIFDQHFSKNFNNFSFPLQQKFPKKFDIEIIMFSDQLLQSEALPRILK